METIKDLKLGLPGLMNLENSIAASAAAYLLKVNSDELRAGLSSFSGVKRRFDFQIKTEKLVYIDDYAHHPEELKACINSTRKMFAGRKITGIFQPHLYSRTRDFADGFAESLSLLDELILLDIYPARELPIDGVSSEILFKNITIKNKTLCNKSELLNILKDKKIDVLLTMGAGDIDTLVKPICEMIG
jgi:UDP-N-acetylmuramate--alanine ligase